MLSDSGGKEKIGDVEVIGSVCEVSVASEG